MGCGDEKLSKYLTQTFTAHCKAMICQQVTLSGDAEGPKVADAVTEAQFQVITARISCRNERELPSGFQGRGYNLTPIGGKVRQLSASPLLCPLVPLSGIV